MVARFPLSLSVLAWCASASAGRHPTADAIPWAARIEAALPLQDAPATDLQSFANGVLKPHRDGRRLPIHDLGQDAVDPLVRATLALEELHARQMDQTPALIDAYWFLYRTADQLAVVAFLGSLLSGSGDPAALSEYLDAVRALGPYARGRFEALVQARLAAAPGDLPTLERVADMALADEDYPKAAKALAPIVKAHPEDARHGLLAVVASVADSAPAKAKKALAAFVVQHPEVRDDAFSQLVGLEGRSALQVARGKLARAESLQNRLAVLELWAGRELGPRFAKLLDESIARYPASVELQLVRVGLFAFTGRPDAARRALDAVTGQPAQPIYLGRRIAVNALDLMQRTLAGDRTVLTALVPVLEKDLSLYRSVDPFVADFGELYVHLARTAFEKTAFKGMGSLDAMSAEEKALMQAAFQERFAPMRKAWGDRLDVLKMDALVQIAADDAAYATGMEPRLDAAVAGTRPSERAEAASAAVVAEIHIGRKRMDVSVLGRALDRLEALRTAQLAWRDRRRADKTLTVPWCPPEGCPAIGEVYSLMGGLRNMLRAGRAPADVPAWDQGTTERMVEGERWLESDKMLDAPRLAELTSHRCVLHLMHNDASAAGLCIRRMMDLDLGNPATQIYAAVLELDMGAIDTMRQRLLALAAEESVAVGYRYEARKWLAFLADRQHDNADLIVELEDAVKLKPLALEKAGGLAFLGILTEGAFNVGLGMNPSSALVHQVSLTQSAHTIPTSPLNDLAIEADLERLKSGK